jgi:putative transposase
LARQQKIFKIMNKALDFLKPLVKLFIVMEKIYLTKNQQIKKTLAETKARRATQDCFTRELKISKRKFNSTTKHQLNRMFLEAKWFYNNILSQENAWDFDTKIHQVPVVVPNKGTEIRDILFLSSQMKQSMHTRIRNAIYALSKLPVEKRGKLKFKAFVTSIPLKQYGVTYQILNNKYIKIQNIKQKLKVFGLEQIPSNAEIASANLISKTGDYYLKVTFFLPKEEKIKPENKIAIDFGIETDLTFSNGIKVNVKKPILNSIIRAHKNLSKKTKHSKNAKRAAIKLRKVYSKQTNQKKDKRNKIVSFLTKNFQVVVQNENIKSWNTKLFGKSIQLSAIGGIIAGLKQHPHTLVVNRWFPSTKLCNECGKLNSIKLSERTYVCACGNKIDRDVHSAINILKYYFPVEHREQPEERKTSVLMFEELSKIPSISISFLDDLGSSQL